jgi:predicted PurR-regulated permease PerM
MASAAIAVLALLWFSMYVLLLTFAGVLLAVFLLAMADGVRRVTGLSRGWSLGVALLASAGIISVVIRMLAPKVTTQLEELRETLPAAVAELGQAVEQYRVGEFLIRELPEVDELRGLVTPAIAEGAAALLTTTAFGLVGFVVIFFIGLYIAVSPDMYFNGLVRLFPPRRRRRMAELFTAVNDTLRWWLIARILAMVFVGVATGLGLWALGVPMWLTLGVIAGALDFVPNVGPIVAAVPALIIAFGESPRMALYVLILYFIVQQVESYVVTPIVQQRTVSLPPVVTVVAQVLFFILAGPLGLLLATPIAAVVLVLVKGLYVQDALGDREVDLL